MSASSAMRSPSPRLGCDSSARTVQSRLFGCENHWLRYWSSAISAVAAGHLSTARRALRPTAGRYTIGVPTGRPASTVPATTQRTQYAGPRRPAGS